MLGIFADPANTTDSPDLGPPPVAHFDEGDPIKFHATQRLSPESTEDAQQKLSVNLETRKRRRESSHQIDVGVKNANIDSHEYTASIATAMAPSQPMKSSTKRKFNARDDDDLPTMADERGKQGSQLNRRGSELPISDNSLTNPIPSDIIKAADEKVADAAIPSKGGKDGKDSKDGKSKSTVTATGRKALGPSKWYRRSNIGEVLTAVQKV